MLSFKVTTLPMPEILIPITQKIWLMLLLVQKESISEEKILRYLLVNNPKLII